MTRYFLLRGWHGSVPGDWQSLWPGLHQQQACFTQVDQDDWAWPKRGDWMMNLDEALLAEPALAEEPAVLVAHGLACHLVAAWAAHTQHTRLVKGAWLVAPPDLDGEPNQVSMAPPLHGWRSVIRQPLPFPSVVLASSNDAHASLTRSRALAADWDAAFENLGDADQVNEASGHGPWPEGWARLKGWASAL